MPLPLVLKTLIAEKVMDTLADKLAKRGGRPSGWRATTAGGGSPLPAEKLMAVPGRRAGASVPASGVHFSPDRSCIALQIPVSAIYKMAGRYRSVINTKTAVAGAALAVVADAIRSARKAQVREYEPTDKATKDNT